MKKLGKNDVTRNSSATQSGFGRNLANWIGKRKVYPSNVIFLAEPTNVLHLPTVSSNKNHCAAYPESLPTWFIKLFTKKGEVVLDPFIGSGTTAIAAIKNDRKYIGIDLSKKYSTLAEVAVRKAKSNYDKRKKL